MFRLPEMKQNTLNLIIVSGVIVLAIGSWTVPWYQGELAVGKLNQLDGNLDDLQDQVDDIKSNQEGTGAQGTSLAQILAAGADENDLQNLLGDGWTAFNTGFLAFEDEAEAFSTFEVISFPPTVPRFKLPNDLAGTAVIEDRGNDPGDTACNTAGTALAATNALGHPFSVDGFAILAPDDLDGDQGGNPGSDTIQIEVCISGANEIIIIDELFQIDKNEMITKNFDFGVVPDGKDLRVVINTSAGDASGTNVTYRVWMFYNDPVQIEEIKFVNDLQAGGGGVGATGGLAAFGFCDSITVKVDDSNNKGVDDAFVIVGHDFLPFESSDLTSGGGAGTPATATFDTFDFGGIMPGGEYFIEIFPPNLGDIPSFLDIDCPDLGANGEVGGGDDDSTVEITVEVGGASAHFANAETGTIQVDIVNEVGVPIPNTQSFVDPFFAPFINDVCEDGTGTGSFDRSPDDGSICVEIDDGDLITGLGQIVDPAADGTFQITGLQMNPLSSGGNTGIYEIETCTDDFICDYKVVTLFKDTTTIVTMKLFGATP